MKLFPPDDDVVLYDTRFEDDVLERTSISKQLSELVERIEDPIVLALDDKWGSGKTFFLKRWVAAHVEDNQGTATTIYFDAFENDYLSDPLISIISAVSARLPEDQEETIQKWKLVATKLAKPAFGLALSLATLGAKEQLNDLGDAIVDLASAEVKDATQDLWNIEKGRREAMQDFRNLLKELTNKSEAPIVVVVDELDRCRPDYALNVLEVIKHFFTVPKVHFILGINGKALENSVKARYGAEIDAESYLRKFINVSFSLPRGIGNRGEVSVLVRYASKLISDMELPTNVSDRCVSLIKCVTRSRDISLRDVAKILSKVALLPNAAREKNHYDGRIDILCALLVTSVVDPQLHIKLVSGDVKTQELRDYLAAPAEKTIDNINDDHNPEYDHEVTIWLTEMIYCCGIEDIKDVNDLPSWSKGVEKRFGIRDRKSIASNIQKIWVEIFRI